MNRAVIITEELCALTRGFFSTDVGLRHTFVAHSSSLLVILCLSEKAFSHSFMALFFWIEGNTEKGRKKGEKSSSRI